MILQSRRVHKSWVRLYVFSKTDRERLLHIVRPWIDTCGTCKIIYSSPRANLYGTIAARRGDVAKASALAASVRLINYRKRTLGAYDATVSNEAFKTHSGPEAMHPI